jgi:hypothetical protein
LEAQHFTQAAVEVEVEVPVAVVQELAELAAAVLAVPGAEMLVILGQ